MIDLRSATVTKPSAGMREAMAEAQVGDDVYGEDPSVNALEARAVSLTGKAAGLFVPSGTMANLVALLSQSHPGDSVILSEASHPYHYEGGNIALAGGLLTRTIADPQGKFTAEQAAAQVMQIDDPHFSQTAVVAIENTTNRGGGACYTREEVAAIGALCRDRGLRLHCDGARVFNASVATDTPAAELVGPCDTVSFCLSKGLGAPVGSLVCGDDATIHRARRLRKAFGGGMRQAGVLAAAGLYALDHHVDDLREDHRRTRLFREALGDLGYTFPLDSPTNILYVHVADPFLLVSALACRDVLVLPHEEDRIRVVFHRNLDDNALDQAVEAFKAVAAERGAQATA